VKRLDDALPEENDHMQTDAGSGGRDDESERERLIEAVRNLTHESLINRDVEFGLRAEIHRLEDQLLAAHNATTTTVAEIKRSTTWRVGRTLLKPLSIVKRSPKELDK
jgi:hypothetical protein